MASAIASLPWLILPMIYLIYKGRELVELAHLRSADEREKAVESAKVWLNTAIALTITLVVIVVIIAVTPR